MFIALEKLLKNGAESKIFAISEPFKVQSIFLSS
jgi:hypothetical protein